MEVIEDTYYYRKLNQTLVESKNKKRTELKSVRFSFKNIAIFMIFLILIILIELAYSEPLLDVTFDDDVGIAAV